MMRSVSITGTGTFAPGTPVPNTVFDERHGVEIDAFLRENRNILQRYYMDKDQATSDLIVPAAREALDEDTWDLIRHVNAFGAPGIDAHVATLWRHLGNWPNLLSLIYSAFAHLHVNGSIAAAAERMVDLTRREGERMAPWRNEEFALSEQARNTLIDYVNTPTQVVRMVTLGHVLAQWLPSRQHAPPENK